MKDEPPMLLKKLREREREIELRRERGHPSKKLRWPLLQVNKKDSVQSKIYDQTLGIYYANTQLPKPSSSSKQGSLASVCGCKWKTESSISYGQAFIQKTLNKECTMWGWLLFIISNRIAEIKGEKTCRLNLK